MGLGSRVHGPEAFEECVTVEIAARIWKVLTMKVLLTGPGVITFDFQCCMFNGIRPTWPRFTTHAPEAQCMAETPTFHGGLVRKETWTFNTSEYPKGLCVAVAALFTRVARERGCCLSRGPPAVPNRRRQMQCQTAAMVGATLGKQSGRLERKRHSCWFSSCWHSPSIPSL